eukprot:gene1713-33119_t
MLHLGSIPRSFASKPSLIKCPSLPTIGTPCRKVAPVHQRLCVDPSVLRRNYASHLRSAAYAPDWSSDEYRNENSDGNLGTNHLRNQPAQPGQPVHVKGILQQYWGYSEFRDVQEEVIHAALNGQDCLVVMATGAGKSLCFQIPALHTKKPCIVISPLISLMEDQVSALNARGISACLLGSAQTDNNVRLEAFAGAYQFVYMTPELAVNSLTQLRNMHSRVGICLFAIDEAHCVTEWGHDFRPNFLELWKLREAIPDVPIMALTATAGAVVQREIIT